MNNDETKIETPSSYEDDLKNVPRDELIRRILNQGDYLRAFNRCLDDLGCVGGFDKYRTPKDIQGIVKYHIKKKAQLESELNKARADLAAAEDRGNAYKSLVGADDIAHNLLTADLAREKEENGRLREALERMVALYESEQDCPDDSSVSQWRPEWLKQALARSSAAGVEGEK